MNLPIIERWMQREDDVLVDFAEETGTDIGDIEQECREVQEGEEW